MNGEKYHPLYTRPAAEAKWARAQLAQRKEKFAELNRWIGERGGWLTSIPGDKTVALETLPDSNLPDELRKLNYKVEPDGETTRILPLAVTEKLVRAPNGELVPLTPGSTAPVVLLTQHAGIARVLKFTFTLP